MKEILPGIFHWRAPHPKIKIPVSSYYLREENVVLDPVKPEGGFEQLPGKPEHILLTNRHHYRASGELVRKLGCTVWCAETGLHEFTHGEKVRGFAFGETLPGNLLSIEIGALCPDETALSLEREGGVVALADGVVRRDDGPLGFVPDDFMGDDPEEVKKGLRAAYRRLLERKFEHLLLAHGNPWIGGAHEALRRFVR
jgi:hypothetical protein